VVQASSIRDALRDRGVLAELEIITTAGDRRAPDTAWGEGAFVTAIEDALLAGRIDVAVHSAKDVPTDEDPRLLIAAYVERAPSGDVVVVPVGRAARSLADLPAGSRVGTDSPRRTAFLRAVRPDLVLHPLHGNVDTRLRRLDEGQTDALVLAEAGLTRLGRGDRIAFRLPVEVLPPAPGQGALAVQIRADDVTTTEQVARLDDASTRLTVTLERDILAASGGGCRAPIGASATVRPDGGIEVVAGFARPDGSLTIITRRDVLSGERASLATLVAEVLAELSMRAVESATRTSWPRIMVTRTADQAPALVLALVDRGVTPVVVPAIAIEPIPGALDDPVRRWSSYDWIVITSSNAAAALVAALGSPARGRGPRWAAIGKATTRELLRAGVRPAFRPERSSGRALAEALPIEPGQHVLAPRSDVADDGVVEVLERRGAVVDAIVAYRTIEAPASSVRPLERGLEAGIDAVVLTSGSTARGLVGLADALGRREAVLRIPAICIGEPTAAEARRLGFEVVATSARQAVGAIADAAAGYLEAQEVAS
jgi:hydroxymethylbilane synthase